EDGIRGKLVTGVQTCALPIWNGTRRRRRSVHPTGGPGKAVSRLEAATCGFPRGQLDDVTRATAERRAERPQVPDDLEHNLIGVDKRDVDREEKKRRVERPARPEDDPFAGTELAPSEQASKAPERGVGNDTALAQHLTVVLPAENECAWIPCHLRLFRRACRKRRRWDRARR